jgi:hypothetical protein
MLQLKKKEDKREIKGSEEHLAIEEKLEPELEALITTDTRKGLSLAEVETRFKKFGPNGNFDILI